jgi:glucose/arabinose dehydrogenase
MTDATSSGTKRRVKDLLPTHRTRRPALAAVVACAALLLAACSSDAATKSGAATTGAPTSGQSSTSATGATSSTAPASPSSAAPSPSAATTAPTTSVARAGGPMADAVTATTIATGLSVPWGLAFLPDGSALVGERTTGRILRLDGQGGSVEVQMLDSADRGEGGLLGLALSPNYAQDGLIYAYLTTDDDNRVVRFRLGEDPKPVLTGIPAASNHNGGRIAFGPDGLLYVTTGDALSSSRAQDPGSLGGKILRVTPDGEPAPGNPVPGNPLYSLGHRNVEGLAWDAAGRLFATEFGENTWDEVNLIEPGANYGWPDVEGDGGEPTFRDPLVTFPTSEASPSGAAILKSSAFPGYDGDMLIGALRGEGLIRLRLDGTSVADKEVLLSGTYGRLRTVAQAPDGSIWVTTSNTDGRGTPGRDDDQVIRLIPR